MEEQLKAELKRYLAGAQTLEAFEDWFLPSTWAIEDGLAATIRLHLAEYDRGDLDENELQEVLFELLGEDSFTWIVADTEDTEVKADRV
jgi:hypothetical protein